MSIQKLGDDEIHFKALTDGLGFHTQEENLPSPRDWRRPERTPRINAVKTESLPSPQRERSNRASIQNRVTRDRVAFTPTANPIVPEIKITPEVTFAAINATKAARYLAFLGDLIIVMICLLLTVILILSILKQIFLFQDFSFFIKENYFLKGMAVIGALYFEIYFLLGFSQGKMPFVHDLMNVEIKNSNKKNLTFGEIFLFSLLRLLGLILFFIPAIFFAPESFLSYKSTLKQKKKI